MKNIHVFVYGTLRSDGSRPASSFVDAEVVGPATVVGLIYDLGWYPGFKPAPIDEEDYLVYGELILVDEKGLNALDAYEGCPDLYTRQKWYAHTEDNYLQPTFIYVYNYEIDPEDLIVSGDYIKEKGNTNG
jgi:gamma-glutamylcyclotransferase (GGCT)/AIG2-like uncharacterized protein YtfP